MPRFFTCFEAIWYVKTGRLDELRRQLDRGVLARCNGMRFGGSLDWPAIKFSPRDPGYWEWSDTVVVEAARRGLSSEVAFGCDWQRIVPDPAERTRWVQVFATFANSHPSLWAQMANEPMKNGWDEADDPALLALAREFKRIAPGTILSVGDPRDTTDYHLRQQTIAQVADYLVLHSSRAEDDSRYRRWVEHLKGFKDSQVHYPSKALLHDEPMGGASRRQPGRRDNSIGAHVAGAVTGAMIGGYTYLHRPEEDDACPGLVESAFAAEIPGSPDYRFINATIAGSPVKSFSQWDKVRTLSNGSQGWAVAVGKQAGSVTWADGWIPTTVYHLTDEAGTVTVWTAAR